MGVRGETFHQPQAHLRKRLRGMLFKASWCSYASHCVDAPVGVTCLDIESWNHKGFAAFLGKFMVWGGVCGGFGFW